MSDATRVRQALSAHGETRALIALEQILRRMAELEVELEAKEQARLRWADMALQYQRRLESSGSKL